MFDLVYAALPPWGQRVMALAGVLLIGGLMGVLLPVCLRLRALHAPRADRRAGVCRFSVVFAPFLVFVLAVLLMYLHKGWRLLRTGWREQL